MKRKMLLSLAMIILLIVLTACVNLRHEREADFTHYFNDRSLFDNQTITVVTADAQLRQFANAFTRYNPDATIDVIVLAAGWEEVEYSRDWLRTRLLAGDAPVIMSSRFIDTRDPSMSHFFADLFPLMYADPNFSENDYMMNVVRAFATNEQLFGFPWAFSYTQVVANSNVPGLANALAVRQTMGITSDELMELHRLFSAGTQLYYANFHSVNSFVARHRHRFIDLESGQVNFASQEFIDVITSAKELMNPSSISSPPGIVTGHIDPCQATELILSQTYSFRYVFCMQYNFEIEEIRLFVNPTPLVNEYGELLVLAYDTYAISSGATAAQQVLAWDFIRFVSEYERIPLMVNYPSVNRNRQQSANVYTYMREVLRIFNQEAGLQPVGSISDAMQLKHDHYSALALMPASAQVPLPDSVIGAIWEVLHQFTNSLVTAQDAAHELQNRVSLALMEVQ